MSTNGPNPTGRSQVTSQNHSYHYVAVSFYQGPYNNRIVQVTGPSKMEEEKLLKDFGKHATNSAKKHIDIICHTPLDVTNYLSEQFGYRMVSTSATEGEFAFILERKNV